MLLIKKIVVTLLTIPHFLVSCNHNQNLKKQQFDRGKSSSVYELCIIPVYKTEWIDGEGYQNDTMACCCPVGQLFEQLNVYILDIDSFVSKAYNQTKDGYPIQVSPELFSALYPNKVNKDEELRLIYDQTGVDGIVRKLATRSIRDWEENDYEKFKYIVYICWQHNLFFYCQTDDETLRFKWYVSGRKSLMKNYYSLSNKNDVWFNPLTEE